MSKYTAPLREIAYKHGWGVCEEAAQEIDEMEEAHRALVSERDALAGQVRELKAALKEAIVIIDGALYCGHELNITGKERLSRCRAALSLDTHHAASEPVAYLVTGPYVKQAFADFSGASAYCSGLNEGFDEAAYIVRPLYATPPSAALASAPTATEPSDAERYQLLRRGQHWSVIDGIGNVLRGDDLDAAIDSIRATKGGKL